MLHYVLQALSDIGETEIGRRKRKKGEGRERKSC